MPCRSNAGGLVGNGCVFDSSSPGMSDGGTGRSSIGHTGLPVARSKHVGERLLAHLRERLDAAAVDGDVEQRRRGGQVVVPHAVMHGLEVPDALPGLDVAPPRSIRRTGRRPCGSRRSSRCSASSSAGRRARARRRRSSSTRRWRCRCSDCAPSFQVSAPNSPSRGITWKTHFNLPVRTSNAWTSPGTHSLTGGRSDIDEPTITVSRTTTGGESTEM